MSTSCHISVASGWIMCLSAHIFIYFSSSRAVSGRQMSCSQEKKKKIICGEKKKKSGRGGGGKNIWICKSCHSVEPCNEWEMLSPSFIMQRSLLNARQLGPASSPACLPPRPPQTSPVISQKLEPNCGRARSKTEVTDTHRKHLLIAVAEGKHRVFIFAGSLQRLKDF